VLYDAAHRHYSGTMARDTRQALPCCPPAIAIHDDGHMQLMEGFTAHCHSTSQEEDSSFVIFVGPY
jgi:hypothetical protein